MKLGQVGELNWIQSIAKEGLVKADRVAVGIGDDCAVLKEVLGKDQLVSTDTMVESVHFSWDYMKGYDVGYRLAAANISDIAAMGGKPLHMLVSLATNGDVDVDLLNDIYKGLMACASRFDVNLVGGDTVSTSGPMVLTVTILGEVDQGQAILRSGARPQDVVFVTGDLGLAQTGLEVLQEKPELEDQYPIAVDRHRQPKPMVKLGQAFQKLGAHSLNDISDGLASELNEIAKASGCHIMIDEKLLPINANTTRWCQISGKDPSSYALYGGEDFQLVGTAPQAAMGALQEMIGVTLIGIVNNKSDDPQVSMRKLDGSMTILAAKGYDHFVHPASYQDKEEG